MHYCLGFTKLQAIKIVRIVNVEYDHYDMLARCEKEIGKKTYLVSLTCYESIDECRQAIEREMFGFVEGLRYAFKWKSRWK
jgi:hypothetical protein